MLRERICLKENAKGFNFIEITTMYNLGNNASWCNSKRGYYLHVQPIRVKDGVVMFEGFTGLKYLLKEVARKSAKAENEALMLAQQNKGWLIEEVLRKNGLERAVE